MPMTEDTTSRPARPRRRSRLLIVFIAAVVVLVVVRIAATPMLKSYVNNKLDESPKYAGQIGDIDLALLRGAYVIKDVEISKTEGEVPVPLFSASRIEFSTLWDAVKNGTPVGQAELFDPQINIVDSTDESKKQTGAGGKWLEMIDDLFPLQLDRAIVHNGQLHFRNYDSDPKIDISLSELDATAQNIANRQALTDSKLARLDVEALAMDVSALSLAAAYDPSATKPTFDVDAKLLGLPIMKLDNFIRSYAPFDVEAGTLDVETVMASREGTLEGYVQPTIYDLDVFKWSEDIQKDKDNPIFALWEGFIGFIAELKDESHNKLVSNIPVKGDISEGGNVFVASAAVIKDGFAQTYKVNLKNTVSLLSPKQDPEPVPLPPPLEADTLPASE